MPSYIISDEPTNIETLGYIRQNCWQSMDKILDNVRKTRKLHCPYAHTKWSTENFQKNKTAFLESNPGGRYVEIVEDLPTRSLIVVPDGNKGLILRIISGVKTGIIEELAVICKPRNCGHTIVEDGYNCKKCHDSVIKVIDRSDKKKMDKYIKAGNKVEPFITLYRDFELVGDADFEGVWQSIAGRNSAGLKNIYWKLR